MTGCCAGPVGQNRRGRARWSQESSAGRVRSIRVAGLGEVGVLGAGVLSTDGCLNGREMVSVNLLFLRGDVMFNELTRWGERKRKQPWIKTNN